MKTKKFTGIGVLLRKNISKAQLAGFFFANLIGLTVILSGILFYCDSRHHNSTEDKFFSEDYIVVSKKVSGVSLEPVVFTEEEISHISSQPWVKKAGKFTSADFSVAASVNMGGKGMSTYLFFESVPDEFFEQAPAEWEFDPRKNYVPIMLNKDYLALYNFGFAAPQGLPQLSEEMISSIPLKLILRGKNGKTELFDATIAGFSSRLNTIAVPQDFMDWANRKFSSVTDSGASRLILKIDLLKVAEAQKYINENGLEIAGNKEGDSRLSQFFGVVSGVVTAVGFVISLLAIFILVLSIFLLMQKSRGMLHNLILLGYSPSYTAGFYIKWITALNLFITAISIGFSFIARLIWHKSLLSLGLGNGNVLFMIGAAWLYFIIITIINTFVIRRQLFSLWRS